MGHSKFFDDPHVKQVFDPPYPQYLKKIRDDIYYQIPVFQNPYGHIKFDVPDGLLPFILSTPHQFAGSLSNEETKKLSVEMYDTMIQQAQYQVDMLNAQVGALTKQRDQLRAETENQ